MKNVTIQNSKLIPVDSIIYKINKVFMKYNIGTLANRYGYKDLMDYIVKKTPRSQLKNILLDIFNIIEDNQHVISNYNDRSLGAGADNSYRQYYRTDRIIIPTFFDWRHNTVNFRGGLHNGLLYRKSLDGKYYLDDIYYMVYVKRESILEFIYLLLYDQISIHRYKDIFEVHHDKKVKDVSPGIPTNLEDIYLKWDSSYKHVEVDNMITSLDYVDFDESEVFEKLYNKVCKNT